MLFAALLAPGILAGGLMAGDLTGYREDRPAVGPAAGGEVAFEPVLIPAPVHADFRYEGSVPAPVQEKVVVSTPAPSAPEEEVPPVVVSTPPQHSTATRSTSDACPGEWADTWLWEVCREHERRPAQS